MKKYLLGSLAVFIAWSVLDFIIHGALLKSTYEATQNLWRPMAEMNMALMHSVTVVTALAFTAVYTYLIKGGSVPTGVKFGLLWGIAAGFGMGFGTYSYMPIPMSLAWGWFIGAVVEGVIAGALLGWIVKPAA